MAEFYFYPLYFIYHDQWNIHTAVNTWQGWRPIDHKHRGHVHFFFANFNPQIHGQQAHTGSQQYKFRLDDTWSQRIVDKDPNVPQNVDFVGTPKWYFYIKEFWRRVYIQPWEWSSNDDSEENFIGKKGVKYDASLEIHTHGPFRESRENYFYMCDMARTLPVEYYHDLRKKVRDHYLRDEPGPSYQTWNYDPNAFESTPWLIPRTHSAGHGTVSFSGDGPSEDNLARRYAYADSNYIYPTLEYQSVVQLNWERESGHEGRPTGDGWEVTISIPYKDKATGGNMSPFSDDSYNVGVPGNYFHGFETKHPDQVMKYASSNATVPPSDPNGQNWVYDPTEYLIPSGQLGQKMDFHVPTSMQGKEDGYWTEQCLGAIVLAKALVTIRDRYGKEYEVWVTASQYMVQDDFAGTDQNEPD